MRKRGGKGERETEGEREGGGQRGGPTGGEREGERRRDSQSVIEVQRDVQVSADITLKT